MRVLKIRCSTVFSLQTPRVKTLWLFLPLQLSFIDFTQHSSGKRTESVTINAFFWGMKRRIKAFMVTDSSLLPELYAAWSQSQRAKGDLLLVKLPYQWCSKEAINYLINQLQIRTSYPEIRPIPSSQLNINLVDIKATYYLY